MAISDERQRVMPTAHDRETGQELDYKEAVLLTNPANSFIKGEVNFINNFIFLLYSFVFNYLFSKNLRVLG